MPGKKHELIGTSIKIPSKLHAAVLKAAEAQGISFAEIVRRAMIASLTICPTCGHTFERKGSRRAASKRLSSKSKRSSSRQPTPPPAAVAA